MYWRGYRIERVNRSDDEVYQVREYLYGDGHVGYTKTKDEAEALVEQHLYRKTMDAAKDAEGETQHG